ncbi:AMP-binding protein [Roseiconus nitratireducens]|nr:AMP-binding protein [Roseiconus nitratireducens]
MTDDSGVPVRDPSMTLPRWIELRAQLHPQRPAVTFLSDEYFAEDDRPVSLTYRQLWQRAVQAAGQVQRFALEHGLSADASEPDAAPRALLLYPPGLDFLIGFLGAQLAGFAPVPTCYPKPHRFVERLNSAAADCAPSVLLADHDTLQTFAAEKQLPCVQSIPALAIDHDRSPEDGAGPATFQSSELAGSPEAIAFLQYTSGSTSEPKGVVVRHRNVMANLESIRQGFGISWPASEQGTDPAEIDTAVFWLPFYHDMGLIGGILAPLYIGGHTVLLSPRAFLQRPLRWLQVISDYQASITGAPNFAYQLCVDRIPPDQTDGISLKQLQITFCGAEPIAARTLRDFQRRFSTNGLGSETFYPCYGLAEATLLVAGGDGPGAPRSLSIDRSAFECGRIQVLDPNEAKRIGKRHKQELVSCGKAVNDTEIEIVDPATGQPLGEGAIGEIWIRGGGVATGYWSQTDAEESDEESEGPLAKRQFDATLSDGRSGFFRSGDLGFFHEGELFISGRLKDIIILRGRNLFPQDIESTVVDFVRTVTQAGSGDGQTARHSGIAAAFSVAGGRSEALAIIAELPRSREHLDLPDLARQIRRNVIEVHEVDPQHIWLVRAASIPVTTSGKVRRSSCRDQFLNDSVRTSYRYDRSSFSEQAPIAFPGLPERPRESDRSEVRQAVENWMSNWLIARGGVAPTELSLEKPFTDYGLDSMAAVELSGEAEDWTGVALTPEVAWNNPTVASLSEYIASTYISDRACGA